MEQNNQNIKNPDQSMQQYSPQKQRDYSASNQKKNIYSSTNESLIQSDYDRQAYKENKSNNKKKRNKFGSQKQLQNSSLSPMRSQIFQNYYCTNKTHDNSPLNLVCIEGTCQKRGLICALCMHFEHNNHQTLPIKIFLEYYNQSLKQSQDQDSLIQEKILDLLNLQNTILNYFDSLTQNLIEEVNSTKQLVSQLFVQDVHLFHKQQISQSECLELFKSLRNFDQSQNNQNQREFQATIARLISWLDKDQSNLNQTQIFNFDYIPLNIENIIQQSYQKCYKLHQDVNSKLTLMQDTLVSKLKEILTTCVMASQQEQQQEQQQQSPNNQNQIQKSDEQNNSNLRESLLQQHQKQSQINQIIEPSSKYSNIFRLKISNQFQFHQQIIRDITYLDNFLIATCSYDKSIKIYSLVQNSQICVLQSHEDEVYQLTYSKKHQILASSSYDKTVKLWKQQNPAQLDSWKLIISLIGHDGKSWSLAFLDNINKLASGGKNQTIIIWNIFNGNKDFIIKGHYQDTIWSLLSLENGKYMISGDSQKIKIWDIRTFKLSNGFQAHSNRIYSLIEYSKNKVVLSGSMDKTIKIWDSSQFNLLKVINEIWTITSLVIVEQFNLLLVGMMSDNIQGKVTIYSCENFIKERDVQIFKDSSGVTRVLWDQNKNEIISSHSNGILQFTNLSLKQSSPTAIRMQDSLI